VFSKEELNEIMKDIPDMDALREQKNYKVTPLKR